MNNLTIQSKLITVETLNAAGFSCVAGDKVDAFTDCGTVVDGDIFSAGDACDMQMYVKTGIGSVTRFDIASLTIKELIPRPNTGTQPVGDDCVVEVTLNDGDIRIEKASRLTWCDIHGWTELEISTWIPHLPSILEQQVVDKSVLELTERELSDEWANGDKAKWRNESDCVFIGLCSDDNFCVVERNEDIELVFVSELSKPLALEQARIKNGQSLKELFESLQHEDTDAENVWANLADLVTLKSEHHA